MNFMFAHLELIVKLRPVKPVKLALYIQPNQIFGPECKQNKPVETGFEKGHVHFCKYH